MSASPLAMASRRAATGITALAALGLGQQRVDLVDHRIAFDLETDCRIAQQNTKNGSHNGEQNDDDS